MDRLGTWPARGTWLLLPLLIGTVLADALADASPPVQWVAATGLWAGWAAVLVATLVPRGISLTALRIAALAAAGATLVAVVVGHSPTGWRVAGLSWAIVCVAVAFFPATGQAFVDGESYGDEQRYPLRVPGPLLAGPLALAWAAVVAGVAAGPLLLACRLWVVGALCLVVGLPVAWRAALVRRASEQSLGPAAAATDALDLTCGALGLALEAQLVEETDLPTVAPRRGAPNATVEAKAVLFTPTRPGALLTATRARHIG